MKKYALAIAWFGFTTLSAQTGGEFDPTFGLDGVVRFDMGIGLVRCWGLVIQDDSKIVVAGNSSNADLEYSPALLRLLPDGSPDSSFGEEGFVYLDPMFITLDNLSENLALQNDGKIVMCYHLETDTGNKIAITRFNADGSLDTDFGSEGTFVNPENVYYETPTSVFIQEDGKILVVGSRRYTQFDPVKMVAMRFNENGSPDLTFSAGGTLLTTFSSGLNFFTDVKETSDGKLILLGYSEDQPEDPEVIVLQLNANGSTDTSFGTNGFAAISVSNADLFCASLELDNDGNIFLGGSHSTDESAPDPLLIKLTPDGVLDNSFGEGGLVISSISEISDVIDQLTISADGKILAAGNQGFFFKKGLVLRYNPDGSLDNTFGDNGVRIIDSESYRLQNIKQQADDNIVVAGYAYDSKASRYEWRLDRMLYDAPINIFEQTSDPGIIHVYPNPAQDFVNIDFPSPGFPCEATIFNLMGQCVHREMIGLSTSKIQTADLAEGMYTLTIEGAAKTSHRCNFVITR